MRFFLQYFVGLLYSAGTPFSHIFGYIAGVLAIPLIFASGVYRHPPKQLLFLFMLLLWACIRTVFVRDCLPSLHWIVNLIAHWLIPFLAGAVVANMKIRWANVHIWSWVIVVIIGLLSIVGFVPQSIAQKVWKEGMMWGFRHHNWFAADVILALALLAMVVDGLRIVRIIQFVLLLIGFALSGSRGYYIAMVPSALGLALTSKRYILRIIIIVALLFIVVFTFVVPSTFVRIQKVLSCDKAVISRFSCWECALLLWKEYPLSGIGYGQISEYAEHFREYSTHDFIDIRAGITGGMVHNMYLTALLEGGIIGFLLFVLFLSSIGGKLWKMGNSTRPLFWAFIALLLGNFFDTQLRGPSVAPEFFFFIGMFSHENVVRP